MLAASTLIAVGLVVSVLSLTEIMTGGSVHVAQATPQPARPDPDAQKQGAQPALPPAPAEKVAPPIREK